jgi:hypothetical protein
MKAMKRVFRLIVLVLLLGGWTVAGLSLHVIRTSGSKIVVIPKQSLDWRDSYVDTTKWTLDDAASHPAVVNRMIQNGKVELLQHVAPEATGDALTSELKLAIQRGPQVKTPPTTKPAQPNV